MWHIEIAETAIRVWIPGLIMLGLGAGFASALMGIGGGFLFIPVFTAVMGLPYPLAVGCSLGVILGTSISGAMIHRRRGRGELRLAAVMIPFAAAGVELGTRAIRSLQGAGTVVFRGEPTAVVDIVGAVVFVVMLVSISTYGPRECRSASAQGRQEAPRENRIAIMLHSIKARPLLDLPRSHITGLSLWVVIAIALPEGFVAGFLGVGGGFIVVPALVYLIGLSTLQAVATSLFLILASSAYGTARHAFMGNVDFALVAITLIGSVIGAQVGAHAAHRIGGLPVRVAFGCTVLVAALLVAVRMLT